MPSGPPKPKKYDPIKTMKKVSRDSDPHKGSRRGGFHSTPKGKKGYTRKEKHPDQSGDQSNSATPEDETYRELMFPIADVLSWDIPAEGRPCGEGEDPKRGKCNPNTGPEQRQPYSNEPIPHPNDVGVDPAFRGGHGPLTAPQIDDINELDENLDSSRSLVDTAKRMGLHDEGSDALMRQWQQENPGIDDQQTLIVMRDHYEKKIKKPGYEGAGTPVEDQPGFPPTKDPNRGAPWGASMADIVAALDWSTHKSETFDDTGENGLHPAWGLKSIIDRGVKPHEKTGADKRIGEAENSTTKRTVPSKSFKSYSMVHAFEWRSPFSKLEPRGSNPLGGPIGGDPQPEVEEGVE